MEGVGGQKKTKTCQRSLWTAPKSKKFEKLWLEFRYSNWKIEMITLLYLAQGDEHSTTVDVAAMLGQTQIVREILETDLNKFQKNKMGRSPLHYAAR